MADRYVREVDRVSDLDERTVTVGVDYDSVTIGHCGGCSYRLSRSQAEEFAKAFVSACWEAADNARLMAEEASGA